MRMKGMKGTDATSREKRKKEKKKIVAAQIVCVWLDCLQIYTSKCNTKFNKNDSTIVFEGKRIF
jgi:hypothetical protein